MLDPDFMPLTVIEVGGQSRRAEQTLPPVRTFSKFHTSRLGNQPYRSVVLFIPIREDSSDPGLRLRFALRADVKLGRIPWLRLGLRPQQGYVRRIRCADAGAFSGIDRPFACPGCNPRLSEAIPLKAVRKHGQGWRRLRRVCRSGYREGLPIPEEPVHVHMAQWPDYARPLQVVVDHVHGIEIRAGNERVMAQTDRLSFRSNQHGVPFERLEWTQRRFADRRIDPVTVAENVISGIGHIVPFVPFKYRRPFGPAVHVSSGGRAGSRYGQRGIHPGGFDTAGSGVIEVPGSVIVHKSRSIDRPSEIVRRHTERPDRRLALQHIVAVSRGRGVHIKSAVPVPDFGRIRGGCNRVLRA
ncbi:hypothetical protein D1872_215790 [compost metagenome]